MVDNLKRNIFILVGILLLIALVVFLLIKRAGENFTSDHHGYALRSAELKLHMDTSLLELSAFHNLALEQDIVYTIACGVAIGWLAIGKNFPWDDDIDITYRDYDKILRLWNQCEEIKRPYTNARVRHWDKDWEFRMVHSGGSKYHMARARGQQDWFKLIRLNKANGKVKTSMNDLGGLDMFHPTKETQYKGNPVKFSSEPVKIRLMGVDTFLLYDRQHINHLIKKYGKPELWGEHEIHFNSQEKSDKKKNIDSLLKDLGSSGELPKTVSRKNSV